MHTRVILKRYIHNEKRQELIENISHGCINFCITKVTNLQMNIHYLKK